MTLTVAQIEKMIAKADEAGLNKPYVIKVTEAHRPAVEEAIAAGIIERSQVEWFGESEQ